MEEVKKQLLSNWTDKMGFRPAVLVSCDLDDGKKIITATFSLALHHWHMNNFESFVGSKSIVEVSSINVPGPYDSNFLTAVIACIEKKYGHSLEIDSCFLDLDWYVDLPEHISHSMSWMLVRESNDSKVLFYEEVCFSILKWLSENGNIVKFNFE